jgi:hypothetical protein
MDLTLVETVKYSPDFKTAQLKAASEAADTGGTVMRVHAIEARDDHVLFIGRVPSDSLQQDSSGAGRLIVRARGLGGGYTSQGTRYRSPARWPCWSCGIPSR